MLTYIILNTDHSLLSSLKRLLLSAAIVPHILDY